MKLVSVNTNLNNLTEAMITNSSNINQIPFLFNSIKSNPKYLNKNLSKIESLLIREFGLNLELKYSKNPAHNTVFISYPRVNEKGLLGVFNRFKSLITGKLHLKKSAYLKNREHVKDVMADKGTFKLNDHIKAVIVIPETTINLNNVKNYPNLTGRELTSILIHEIGHLITAETYIEHNLPFARMAALMSAFTLPLFIGFINIVFNSKANLTYLTSMVDGKTQIHEEMLADSVAIKYGYGSELASALTKLLQIYKITFHKEYKHQFPKEQIDAALNEFNKSFDIRNSKILELLNKELSDPNNSKEIKENIKIQIKKLERAEKVVIEDIVFTFDDNEFDFLTEENLYDLKDRDLISKRNSEYLLDPNCVKDVILKDYEDILTSISLESRIAREAKDIANLKAITGRVVTIKYRLESALESPSIPREHRSNIYTFLNTLDTIIGKELKPATNETLKSIYTDRTREFY